MEVLGPSGLAPTGLGKTLLELAKHPKEVSRRVADAQFPPAYCLSDQSKQTFAAADYGVMDAPSFEHFDSHERKY